MTAIALAPKPSTETDNADDLVHISRPDDYNTALCGADLSDALPCGVGDGVLCRECDVLDRAMQP